MLQSGSSDGDDPDFCPSTEEDTDMEKGSTPIEPADPNQIYYGITGAVETLLQNISQVYALCI